jgi:hypothetical protein
MRIAYFTLVVLLLTYYNSNSQPVNSAAVYVDFLSKEHLSPNDYIMKLFETNDIVILGERDHRDTTQYDLILELLSDERFINTVGHVYTEVGVVNKTALANEVLRKQYASSADFDRAFFTLYKDLDFNPLWDKYNIYKYFKGIYNINKSLPEERKLTVGLTDCAFDWSGMTGQAYSKFENGLNKNVAITRDSIMAYNFFQLYEKQIPINGRKKALLIQNQPHATNHNLTFNGHRIKSTANFIKNAYGDNVKIVLLNWYIWGSWGFNPTKVELVDNGRWDAAFELTNQKSVGFDLINSPFGNTQYHENYNQNIRYCDIADGFIFYKPFYAFVGAIGIPNIVEPEFSDELIRRYIIAFGENSNASRKVKESPIAEKEKLMKMHNTLKTFRCADYRKMKRQMRKWLP